MIPSISSTRTNINLNSEKFAIGTIWLFQIAALVGISLGYKDWFLSKTPLNLILINFLLIVILQINDKSKLLIFSSVFAIGFVVERIGVHTGVLFGSYNYGENLGLKLDGIPLLIGMNWAMLVFVTGSISNQLKINKYAKIILASSLMVFLDLFMEQNASYFDFWHFQDGVVPLKNYFTWFIVAVIMQALFQSKFSKLTSYFSGHLYASQMAFFVFFYLFS